MSEENVNIEGIGVERVGETIHRERLTRNILLETVASDLKLNVEFIKGIENSTYDLLPSVPYIRVYIKSIAEYLGLNSEELLNRFAEEQNLSIPDPDEERRDTISIRIQDSKRKNPFAPILIIAGIVVAILLLINKKGEEAVPPFDVEEDTVKIEVPVDTGELSEDQLPSGTSDFIDTVESADSTTEITDSSVSVVDTVVEEIQVVEKEIEEPTKKKSLNFSIIARNDSSWVRVFVDGKSKYKGLVSGSKVLDFSAEDSVNCLIGKNSAVRYMLNDSPVDVSGTSFKVFKVSHDGVTLWRKKQWDSTFAGR